MVFQNGVQGLGLDVSWLLHWALFLPSLPPSLPSLCSAVGDLLTGQ